MKSEKKVGEKTRKAVLTVPEGGGDIDRFTGLLSTDRHSIKLTFRIQYSDNGYYACQFFGHDGSTVVAKTDTVGMSSFYPAQVYRLRHREVRLRATHRFIDKIECSAFTGVPQGDVDLLLDGESIPKAQVTKSSKLDKNLKGGAVGYRVKLKTVFKVSMALYNRTITCIAGHKNETKDLPGNKKVAGRSIRLDNLKVPVDDTEILDTKRVFRKVGDQLTCTATGVPKPKIAWRLEGVNGSRQGSTVKVPEKPGIYNIHCIAMNKFGRRRYIKKRKFNFAVVEPCPSTASARNRSALIVALVCAVTFGLLTVIFFVMWYRARRQSEYDRMD